MSHTPTPSFAQFLVSLGSSAMVHLGEVETPDGSAPTKNLELAGQTLAVLRLLESKTQGNLDEDEKRLLNALLGEISGRLDAHRAKPGT